MATFKDYLENNSPLILHGALGTEMEALGYDISGKLWSAKYLLEKSEVIQELHETYPPPPPKRWGRPLPLPGRHVRWMPLWTRRRSARP